MEAMGAEGQWSSLSGVYTAEEADFMALLLNNQLSSVGATLQHFWPPHDQSSSSTLVMNNNNYCSSNLELVSNYNSNLCTANYSGGGGNSIINVFPTSSNDHHHLSSENNNSNVISQPTTTTHSFDFFLAEDLKTANHSYIVHNDKDHDRLSSKENGNCEIIKMCSDHHIVGVLKDNTRSSSDESSAKRPRNFEKVDQVGKKYVNKSKKKQKQTSKSVVNNEEEEKEGGNNIDNGIGGNGKYCSSSTTCCSGDESINGSGQEMSTGGDTNSSLNPNEPNSEVKARARRGSATDPQSLYARKRRERINERLKVLQTLVPNGTKVDISTMLEEAVQYVKFLQLQIKLLSSDELWMYAPIAYNGKDIGLNHLKLSLANCNNI